MLDTRIGWTSDRRWSDEARTPWNPGAAYRALVSGGSPRGTAWRRPALLAFILGCATSAAVSGRFTPRLILDGAIAFAFLPLFAAAAFAVVFRRRRTAVAFGQALDLFFIGHAPWLLWLIGLAALTLVVDPRGLGPWLVPLECSLIAPAVWGLWIDFHFFREVHGRTPREARHDLILHRTLAWSAATTYFLGIAIWGEVLPQVLGWVHR